MSADGITIGELAQQAGVSTCTLRFRADEAALTAAVSEHAGAALADQLERFTDPRVDRYWALLAVINGWPAWPSQIPAFGWFITALRA